MSNNTLIIGAGAVGLGIASCIANSTDWPLTFLTRPGGAAQLLESGLRRYGIFGEIRVASDRIAAFDSAAAIQTGPFDLILICTKSFDSEPVAELLAQNSSLLNAETRLVLFHNGWGSAEIFGERFPRKQIFNARVITGFRRLERNEVEVTVHADDIRIGSVFYPESAAGLAGLTQAINAGGIPAQVTPTVEKDIWAKMLYNCALNPLGAILNATYGALGESASARSLMDRIIDEAFQVMQSCGHSTHWSDADGFRSVFYGKMIPLTFVHESSMLQDINGGRKTEIDFLSGAIVRLGESRGIPVPTNRIVFEQIRFIERRADKLTEN